MIEQQNVQIHQTWCALSFEQLSVKELHDILALRQAIFMLEQDCLYPDIDGRDPDAQHLFMYLQGRLMAACRIFSPSHLEVGAGQGNETQSMWVIGRVVVAQNARGQGLGRELMERALDYCRGQQCAFEQAVHKRSHKPSSQSNHQLNKQHSALAKVVKISAQARLKQFYTDLGFAQSSAPYDEDGIEHIDMRYVFS